jgi:hypothetical protein
LPPNKETIDAISSGVKVQNVSPDPFQALILLGIIAVPTLLILQWWNAKLRIFGWVIWVLFACAAFLGA